MNAAVYFRIIAKNHICFYLHIYPLVAQQIYMQDNSNEGNSPINNPQTHPAILTQQKLYNQYSSSQSYFYSNLISEIMLQKYTTPNIVFTDIQCLLDVEQFLKRRYYSDEFPGKMQAFKQYYQYHQDCPRIFGIKNIAEVYQRWQEKKRDLVYKKLKMMYNETYTSMDSDERTIQQPNNESEPVSQLLLDISEYNPFSKKYYLRVQARQEKQRKQRMNESKYIYNNLNQQLSKMLTQISDISAITNTNIKQLLQVANEEKWNKVNMKKLSKNGGTFNIERNNSKLRQQQCNDDKQINKIKLKLKWKQNSQENPSPNQISKRKSQQKGNQLRVEQGSKQTKYKQSHQNNIYIATQIQTQKTEEGDKKQKHKKQTSQLNNNKGIDRHNLKNNLNILPYNMEMNEGKTKSILRMSSYNSIRGNYPLQQQYSYPNQGNENKNMKSPVYSFNFNINLNLNVNNQQKQDQKPKEISPLEGKGNFLSSYKSLEKNKNPVQIKYSKINTNSTPSNEKLTKLSVHKSLQKPNQILTQRLGSRNFSLKKLTHPESHYEQIINAQQFSDKKLVFDPAISPNYQSTKLYPSTFISLSNLKSTMKQDQPETNFRSINRNSSKDLAYINKYEKSSRNQSKNTKEDSKSKGSNIRITLKNPGSYKLSPQKITLSNK